MLLAAVAAPAAATSAATSAIRFADETGARGIDFRHEDGSAGLRHLPETMGSGVAWLDYDLDGRSDLYFVDSGPLPENTRPDPSIRPRAPGVNQLYRNLGGRFVAVPAQAGDPGYGKGVSVGDYDGDGFADVYVANWGPDGLYRNNGDGTYSNVTAASGLGDARLTSSPAWADLDGDGHLDLFVVTYVAFDPATAPPCGDPGRGIIDYCHPDIFDGQADILYRSRGDGTFEDRSAGLEVAAAGSGKGLAVTVADLNEDGLPDVYVANDTTPNYVYLNRGGMRLVEEGVLSGAALGSDGMPQAGMGIDVGDLDGDLRLDLMVTNFAREPYNLYRAIAPGFYIDDTYALGLGGATFAWLGFGIVMSDFDLDGDLDAAVANGHILRAGNDTEQPNQVFANEMTQLRRAAQEAGAVRAPGPPVQAPPQYLDWRPEADLLHEVSATAGEAFVRRRVSRGLAVGDADADGRLDLALTNVDDVAELLMNRSSGAGEVVVLRLRGRASNRDAIGARVWVTPCAGEGECAASPADGVAGFPQPRIVRTASSFASQNSTDVHVGLGTWTRAHVRVEWPSGLEESAELPAGAIHLLVEGRGVVARRPLPR